MDTTNHPQTNNPILHIRNLLLSLVATAAVVTVVVSQEDMEAKNLSHQLLAQDTDQVNRAIPGHMDAHKGSSRYLPHLPAYILRTLHMPRTLHPLLVFMARTQILLKARLILLAHRLPKEDITHPLLLLPNMAMLILPLLQRPESRANSVSVKVKLHCNLQYQASSTIKQAVL